MNEATVKICQSCSMPLTAAEYFGTNSNGSLSADYCCFCFQNGNFTNNMSMEETIASSISFYSAEQIDGRTMTVDEFALKKRVQFPTLKRWNTHNVTHQEYFKAINIAVEFINENLNETINLYNLAGVANISSFHFHRIFKAMMSESPGEYIQRLRLEKAAFKLQTTQQTILEIAEQTGYQSSHALSKAFKKRFGITPAIFRKQSSHLSVPIETPAFIRIEPEIRKINDKQVIAVRVVNPFVNTGAFVLAWKKLIRFAGVNGIPDNENEYFSLSRDTPAITRLDLYRAYVCVTANPDIKPKGEFGKQTINGGLYAVFTYKGAYKNLEHLYCFIYRNWIPNSEYELRDMAFFEKFLNSPDTVKQDDLLTEVYIPVTRLK